MRVLLALTYYRPYISGLTIYVERLGRALAEHGHEVTVLTSQYSSKLPLEERIDGIHVVRVPVAMRLSKGVIMPLFGYWATRLARENDVLSIHLPQFDAAGIALRGRLFNKPSILTYHCDLELPPGLFNRAIDRVVYGANYAAAQFADRIVTYTQDYADNTPFLTKFSRKLAVIPPPVVMPSPTAESMAAFQEKHGLKDRRVLGYAARFATEKGIEYLIDGMPKLLQRFPDLKVLFAGPYRDVLGEEDYWQRLSPRIKELGDHWEFVGTLSPEQLPAFYGSLDSLLVTSINSTESFGLVQVEAMLCGTPVVVGALPGVRQPVRLTGMGEVVPVADTPGLVLGIEHVLSDRERYVRPRTEIERLFDIDVTVQAYEELFEHEIKKRRRLWWRGRT
jgi:glycosyltransferase involved in cell wall biosynthesis